MSAGDADEREILAMKMVLHLSMLFSLLFQNAAFVQYAVAPRRSPAVPVESVSKDAGALVDAEPSARPASVPEISAAIIVTPTAVVTATVNL